MLLEVGRIDKPHGLRGDVIVRLTTNVAGRLDPGATLFGDPTGDRPMVVEASQPHQDRWIVHFAGCARREDAESLHGTLLYGEPVTDDDPDVLWIHELVGAEVRELDGRGRGRVVAVIDNPASDLLELDDGALVPLRFVVDHSPGQLVVEVPAGLFET